jgi:hypothetical protein
MVNLLTWAIKKPLDSSELAEYGYPKGAVALAAAGVHSFFFFVYR